MTKYGWLSWVGLKRLCRWGLVWVWLLLLTACRQSADTLLDSDILFHDEFVPGATGNWLLEEDVAGRTTIVDEQLSIQVDTVNMLQFASLRDPILSDFVLDVEARLVAGDPAGTIGVLARMQDNTQFYRFAITGTGLYLVERRNVDGSWTRYQEDWAMSPAIQTGLNAVNRLRIMAQGATMRFYVNETLLQEVTDSQYTAGMMALEAGTYGQPGMQVVFDNLVVKRP